MKVTVLVVGKVKHPLADAVAEYEARARRYWRLEVVEVPAGAGRRGAEAEVVRRTEAERLLARIPAGSRVVALTRAGEGMNSRELARYLQRLATQAVPDATFLIGGAFGLSPRIVERADRRLALSRMTLPHEMARLFLAEQLYRAGTIVRGEPYHKGD